MSDIRPVVISGPSGTGKSTLLKKLFNEFPNSFGFSVSHTTRSPRAGEVGGKDYHFVDRGTILAEIGKGVFIEHAEFSKNIYGTSKKSVQDVLDMNRICVLDVDEQGVKSIKSSHLDSVYIFIKPPSLDELRSRLSSRGTETKDSIESRMNTAISAIKYSETGVYDCVITNDQLEHAYDELKLYLSSQFSCLR